MSVSNNTEIAGLNVSLRGRLVDLKKNVQRILEILSTIAVEDDGGASLDIAYFTQTRPREENNTGRPLLAITRDQLEHLRSLHFSWQKISKLLHVSISTIQRRRKEFSMEDLKTRQGPLHFFLSICGVAVLAYFFTFTQKRLLLLGRAIKCGLNFAPK